MKLTYLPIILGAFILLFSFCKQNQDSNDSQQLRQDQAKEEVQKSMEDIVYDFAAEMPRFPGCEDQGLPTIEKYLCANKRLNNYISNRLRYPKLALNNRVEGTVIAKFVVRQDGLLEDIMVENDIGYGCGKTVLGIVESMNHMNERWIPGKQGGVPVKVQMKLPVEFRLMIDEDKK